MKQVSRSAYYTRNIFDIYLLDDLSIPEVEIKIK